MPYIKNKIAGAHSRIIRCIFYITYFVKWKGLRILIGDEGLASVLCDSLFPDIVLKMGGAAIGKNVRIHRYLILHESKGNFRNLEIGDDVFIGKSCIIDLTDTVKIGNRCAIGMAVKINTHINLGDSSLSKEYPPEKAPVEIADDSVVLWGCIINKGTVIQKEVLILPGSVVSGTLKQGATYCGNPARVTYSRSRLGDESLPDRAGKDPA